jgi:hypothetical protein
MKNHYSILIIFMAQLFSNMYSQSYEEMNIENVTTTPSASRSANFIDVNNDGLDDIYFSNGLSSGQSNFLYINNGNGTFTTIEEDDIVLQNGRSDGVSFADVDNDGDLDCVEVTWGGGGSGNLNYFYRNNGDGSFTHEAGSTIGTVFTYSEMANWIDVNNDQFLDLYITNSEGSLENLYYENQGDGQQINNLPITDDVLPSRSIDWIDYDNDGDSDLFITNESNNNNSLFRNDGVNNFTQIENIAIVQDNNTSAGSSWADIDNDGDFDLFVANWDGENNQLFLNNGGDFVEQINSPIASGGGSSFGSSFGDMNNDGYLDLIVCNSYFGGQNKNFVYMNNGDGTFTQDTSSALANHLGFTFGCAFGDYDNDGWLDIILANTNGENQANSLYHNTGSGNNWIKVLLKGTTSNASAIGAVVRVNAIIDGSPVWQTRRVTAASGYCSQNSFNNHFGLGNANIIDEIVVTWPSGAVESFTNIDINNRYIIEEGTGIFLGINNVGTVPWNISIFPNPASDHIQIKISEPIHSSIYIEIIDLSGRVLFKEYYQTSENIIISKGGISSGEYLLKLTTEENSITKKIIFK